LINPYLLVISEEFASPQIIGNPATEATPEAEQPQPTCSKSLPNSIISTAPKQSVSCQPSLVEAQTAPKDPAPDGLPAPSRPPAPDRLPALDRLPAPDSLPAPDRLPAPTRLPMGFSRQECRVELLGKDFIVAHGICNRTHVSIV